MASTITVAISVAIPIPPATTVRGPMVAVPPRSILNLIASILICHPLFNAIGHYPCHHITRTLLVSLKGGKKTHLWDGDVEWCRVMERGVLPLDVTLHQVSKKTRYEPRYACFICYSAKYTYSRLLPGHPERTQGVECFVESGVWHYDVKLATGLFFSDSGS